MGLLLITGIFPANLQSNAISTETISNSEILNLPINIKLQFWGFDTSREDLSTYLMDTLPNQINSESITQMNHTPSVHTFILEGNPYHFQTEITYHEIINDLDTEYLINKISPFTVKSNIAGYFDNGSGSLPVAGWRIPVDAISDALAPYNDEEDYTIHLINLSELYGNVTTNSTHWYNIGKTSSIEDNLHDFRNVGFVEDKGIFIDPTAFAGDLDSSPFDYSSSFDLEDMKSYLADRLSQIIENVIIGSPQNVENRLPLERSYHVALIYVASSERDIRFLDAYTNRDYTSFKNAISNLLPYFNITFRDIRIGLDDYPNIDKYLSDSTFQLYGTPTIFVDHTFAEDMKYLVRNDKTIYDEFPSEYFYPIYVMVDSQDRQYLVNADDVEYRQYEAGELGFSILNLKDWENDEDLGDDYILNKQLEIFGKMLGLTQLRTNYVSQFVSPLSNYGISNHWDKYFSPFEEDVMARKYGGLFNYTAMVRINQYRSKLDGFFYSWINATSLDVAEAKLEEANILYRAGLFKQSVHKYIIGYNLYADAVKEIQMNLNAFNNSFYLLGAVIMISYIIYVLRDMSISRDEFKKRIKAKLKIKIEE
jgi:hypothetical protein